MTSMINRHTKRNSRVSEMAAFLGQPFAFAGRIALRIRERRELNRMLSFLPAFQSMRLSFSKAYSSPRCPRSRFLASRDAGSNLRNNLLKSALPADGSVPIWGGASINSKGDS